MPQSVGSTDVSHMPILAPRSITKSFSTARDSNQLFYSQYTGFFGTFTQGNLEMIKSYVFDMETDEDELLSTI